MEHILFSAEGLGPKKAFRPAYLPTPPWKFKIMNSSSEKKTYIT